LINPITFLPAEPAANTVNSIKTEQDLLQDLLGWILLFCKKICFALLLTIAIG
jgi:hypothetical protein